jgi:NADPH-dependent curcumin reductase CurA
MAERINRRWLVASAVDEAVTERNFQWSRGAVEAPKDGQALVRNLWLSADPTQILRMGGEASDDPENSGWPVGGVMRGFAVSQVLESRHPGWAPGDLLHGYSGWEDYSVIDGRGYFPTWKVPAGVTPSAALGTLGVTGMVAYFGMVEVARPRAGETCVVSAAAGGVGSVAAQIAKIHGMRVIGIAGGTEKCAWLTGEAGLDGAIDRQSEDVAARLDALCPAGIDVFFDNTGGPILDDVLLRLRRNGRIVLCGGTSRYLASTHLPGPKYYLQLVMVDGRMEGLLGKDYVPRFPEAVAVMRGWLAAGRLKQKDDVLLGLENAPGALVRLFSGANLGKQLVKIADPSGPA